MAPLNGLRVIRSSIHGYGVVTTRPFRKGERVAVVDGVLWKAEDVPDDTYCLYVDGDHLFDMVDQTRWINHSCDPNIMVEAELGENGGGWARMTALRDIQPEEELAYDYAFPAEIAEPCACGAANCRGWIVDVDELSQLQERQEQERGAAAVSG